MIKILNFIKEYWFIISGVLVPIATYYIGQFESKNKKIINDINLLKQGICALQRDTLLKLYKTCESRDWCSVEEKESINELYESYHSLGGNSFITDMIKHINKLPIKEKKGR